MGDDWGMELQRAIDDFGVYQTAERGFSAHTVRSYRSDLLRLVEFAGENGVEQADGLSLENHR